MIKSDLPNHSGGDWDISAGFPAIRMVLQIDFDTLELLDKTHDGFTGKGNAR